MKIRLKHATIFPGFLLSLLLLPWFPAVGQDAGPAGTTQGDLQNLASMPYRKLIKLAQSNEALPKDAKSYRLKVTSSLGVAPEKIELVLKAKESPIHLIVDDKGFFEVPNTLELLDENPMLVANQPRGTLIIPVELAIPPFDPPKIENGKVHYQELFRPLIELQKEFRKIDPTFGLLGKDQFALSIKTDQPLKIVREFGSRTFRPDESGIVLMILETYLHEENPLVQIPGKVEMNIRPVSASEAEEIKATY